MQYKLEKINSLGEAKTEYFSTYEDLQRSISLIEWNNTDTDESIKLYETAEEEQREIRYTRLDLFEELEGEWEQVGYIDIL